MTCWKRQTIYINRGASHKNAVHSVADEQLLLGQLCVPAVRLAPCLRVLHCKICRGPAVGNDNLQDGGQLYVQPEPTVQADCILREYDGRVLVG